MEPKKPRGDRREVAYGGETGHKLEAWVWAKETLRGRQDAKCREEGRGIGVKEADSKNSPGSRGSKWTEADSRKVAGWK